jgi:hypothetical protein
VILARYLNFKTSGEIAFKGGYPVFCLLSKLLKYTVRKTAFFVNNHEICGNSQKLNNNWLAERIA